MLSTSKMFTFKVHKNFVSKNFEVLEIQTNFSGEKCYLWENLMAKYSFSNVFKTTIIQLL